MKRLLVVQPYIPAYRVAFFRDVRDSLSAAGFELHLAAGNAQGYQAQRHDDSTESTVDLLLRTRTLTLGRKKFLAREIGSVLRRVQPQLVIAEQAVKNLENFYLLGLQNVRQTPRVAFWGQGKTFSSHQGRAANSLKQWMTRRGEWFFAYTQEGADYVIDRGVPASTVTVLNNTVDSESLKRDLANVSHEDLEAFRNRHSLIPGKTAIFIGGVDHHKGIHFLLDSAKRVSKQVSGFKLLVVGSGAEADLVRGRQARGDGVVSLGRLTGYDKALALQAADVMMIPEWIGLVAVDSLIAGCPIVTTDHSSHSPEFLYLQNHRNAFVFRHEVEAYADGIARVLRDTGRLARVRRLAREDSQKYLLQNMVRNFTRGVESWWHARAESAPEMTC